MTKDLLAITRGSATAKPMRLLELKQEGHDLIDELILTGVTRSKVYNRMRKRLKRAPGKEHFGKMNTVAEAQEAVDLLAQWMLDRVEAQERERNPPPPKAVRRRADTLPHDQYLKAMEELRKHRAQLAHPSRWTRIRHWIKINVWQRVTKTK